jgi:hypothetical protein
MALGDLTKQLAQQALLNATSKEPAAPQPESLSGAILAEVGRMQKALKEDEELVVFFQNGTERIRIHEIFIPSRLVAVLSGADSERHLARVIAPIESLQLVCKVTKAPAGAKPLRINLITRKASE